MRLGIGLVGESTIYRERRLELGLSQRQLAERVGVAPGTISVWERDLWLPRNSLNLRKWMKVLKLRR